MALGGAGRKTFRHLESSINSTMLMWADEISWAYPWVGGDNCIKCNEGNEVEAIFEMLQDTNLYDIYLHGVENCRRYEVNKYITEYIEPLINK